MCPVKAKNDENQGHKPHEKLYRRNSSTLKMHFLVLPVEKQVYRRTSTNRIRCEDRKGFIMQ